MNHLRRIKNAIREEYLERRLAMDPDLKSRLDGAICRQAVGMVGYRFADCVLMYSAVKGEIDVSEIALHAFSKGKKVAFPRCCPEKGTMDFHIVTSLDDLHPGTFGVPEPDASLPVFDPTSTENSVCYVPGLVFDTNGYRVGYGKGYYDRYLSNFKGSIVGITYSDCILKSVPRGHFDVSIRVLLTEKGVRVTSEI